MNTKYLFRHFTKKFISRFFCPCTTLETYLSKKLKIIFIKLIRQN